MWGKTKIIYNLVKTPAFARQNEPEFRQSGVAVLAANSTDRLSNNLDKLYGSAKWLILTLSESVFSQQIEEALRLAVWAAVLPSD